jgi:hypothetical protein
MAINPVQFAHNVCDELLRYIFRISRSRTLTSPGSPTTNSGTRRSTSPWSRGRSSPSEAFAKGEPIQR